MSTATLSDNTPLDPDDELLVAYLDGELGRKEQSELENRLIDDAGLRQRLQQLQSGWELLDDLPDPAPSLKLVESTLELVVADIVKASPKQDAFLSRAKLPILIGAVCLLGIFSAFAIVAWINSQRYRQQLQDLAIVENLDAYRYGSDLELMRQLSADPEWSKMVAASREIGDIQIESIADLSAVPVEEREERIASLPLEKIDQLDARWKQFMRLDEANRERIRRTAEAVEQQADGKFLLKTMQAYEIWRDRLPPDLRDKIETMDGKERRDAIEQAIERTQLSISRRSSMKLDDDSIEWIYFALRQVLQQRIDGGDQPTIEFLERHKSRSGADYSEYMAIASIVMSGSGSRGPRWPFMGRMGDRPAPLHPHELQTISLALPERALEILDSVALGDTLKEATTIGMWAEEAVRRKAPFKRDDSTPLQRYKEMDENERDILDLQPPKEILRELAPDSRRFRAPP